MKKILFLLCLPVMAFTTLQPEGVKPSNADVVRLVCKIVDLPTNVDSLTLYEFGGLGSKPIKRAHVEEGGAVVFVLPASEPRFYALGINDLVVSRVILGREPEVSLWGYGLSMDKCRTFNSPINMAYEKVRREIGEMNEEGRTIYESLLVAKQSGADQGPLKKQMNVHEAKVKDYLKALKKENQFLWYSATLMMGNQAEIGFSAAEKKYEMQSFFPYADLSNRAYDETPMVFDAFLNYGKALVESELSQEDIKKTAENTLAKIPSDSKTYRMAMAGLIAGFKTKEGPLYILFAQKFVDKYRNNHYGEVPRLSFEIRRAATFTPGMEAPDLVGKTPMEEEFALSKLRGKYVLIDFWASWCGPCRRENPNVKAVYETYKSKGFEILGVSLDQNPESWKAAIEKDGLTWPHISDLKGWQSEHAKLYSVSSIPQTVLIDPSGKIVQRNLRGDDLRQKLQQIFGGS